MSAVIRFPYADEAVAIARKLPGARFEGSSWRVYPRDAAEVEAVVDGVRRLRALMDAKADALHAEEVVKRERIARRKAVLAGTIAVGDVIDTKQGMGIVESLGSVWEGTYSARLRGTITAEMQDRDVQYAYYRDATTDEAEAAVAASAVKRPHAAADRIAVIAGKYAPGQTLIVGAEMRIIASLGHVFFADSAEYGSFLPPNLWEKQVQDAFLEPPEE